MPNPSNDESETVGGWSDSLTVNRLAGRRGMARSTRFSLVWRSMTMSIESVLQSYETALNANDVDSIVKLYGSEPVFMPQHAPAMVGRDAVRAAYEHVFNTIKLDIKFTTHEVETQGDTAWARTSSAGRTRILAAGIEIQEGNNELFVFRKENGDWKIHRYLFSTNQPRN